MLRGYFFIVYIIIYVHTPRKCSYLKTNRRFSENNCQTMFLLSFVFILFVSSRKCNDRDAFCQLFCVTLCMISCAMLEFCFIVSKVYCSLKNSLILPSDYCLLGIMIVTQLQIVEYYDLLYPRSEREARVCVEGLFSRNKG